jgi:acyl dehydratase
MEHDMRRHFGGYYEDFHVGEIYRHWPGKTIFESDNNLFCLLTMNHHPVHLDINYCRDQKYGRILVCGPLVISIVIGMTVSDISGMAIANLGYERISHDRPVFINDTLYAVTRIIDKQESKPKSDQGVIYVETKAYNQNKKRILTLRRHVLVPKGGRNHETL